MFAKNKILIHASVYLASAMLLLASTGCASGTSKTMPAMLNNAGVKITQYKTVESKSMTLDKVMELYGTVKYATNIELYFKNKGGRLKAVNTSLNQTVNKGDILAELDSAVLENQLAMKRIELERVNLKFEQLKLEYEINSGAEKYELENLKADIETINLDMDGILKELDESKLIAPISGIVTAVSYSKIGENVPVYEPFIKISKPDDLFIVTEPINPPQGDFTASYSDPSGICSGMDATIRYTGNINEFEFPGTVLQVSMSFPEQVPGEEDLSRLAVFPPLVLNIKPKVQINDKLRPGDSVHVFLNTGRLEKAVVIPDVAIQGFGDDTVVNILKNGKVIKRPVRTGYKSEELKLFAITAGLLEGETVIIN